MAQATHRLDEWLYRGKRPNRLARLLNAGWARLATHGLAPARLATLEVEGRRSHRTVSFPVVVADLDGDRYVVSMLGDDTNWVRNVRAAHGEAVLSHGGHHRVRLEEIPVAQRPPILRRYLECAPGARAHFPIGPDASIDGFADIAANYPVFRVVVVASETAA